jgi:hypothetical protein
MKNSKAKNITVPAGTVALLKEMFTSNQGVDLSAIIQDLSVETGEDLVAINLGLLMNNKVLEVPQKVYTFSHSKGQLNRVYVRIKTGHSLLKDVVNYTYYTFELHFDDDGNESWVQSNYVSHHNTCSIASWFDCEEQLPDGLELPELVDED